MRIKYLRDCNLFPDVENLLKIERKYGDSLSLEDLLGVVEPKKKKKVNAQGDDVTVAGTT